MSVPGNCKFGWKRKIGSHVSKSNPAVFNPENQKDEDEDFSDPDVDWLSATKARKLVSLEDAFSKSKRLLEEGTLLAEAERYWEAISKWNEALQLTPKEAKLHEMKAQALMILCEVFPAMVSAQHAVDLNPNWWVALQTLGRTQLNIGEVKQAIKSFSKAIHLHPVDSELWKEDLFWAYSLLDRKEKVEQPEVTTEPSGATVKEIHTNDSGDDLDTENSSALELYQDNDHDNETGEKTPVRTLPKNYVLMRD